VPPGADRIQKKEQRREARQDRCAHTIAASMPSRCDTWLRRMIVSGIDRAAPLANCVPVSWMPVASNTIE
jgi:hypothetical protein